ncbi:MAG: GAF and ANTAR domain-containing protein [Actinomycetota bacterium]|nr:GAF and ANTAR domain-containing protein [Actinomycetota bacterium]
MGATVVIDANARDATDDDDRPDVTSYGTLAQLARGLRVPSGELQPTLEAIVQAAVRTVPGTDDAGLILVRRGALVPVATTGARPASLDESQAREKLGPCFDAAAEQEIKVVTNLAGDPRWPALHEAAAELGVAGMVCVPLVLDDRTAGTLSLYSSRPGAFDDADLGFTELFATHAALALGEAQRTEQLHHALASRDLLGQAKGILMERLRIGPDAAFAELSVASQATNQKVVAVADHLVRTGELLGAEARARG